jgi:hypothetical protein
MVTPLGVKPLSHGTQISVNTPYVEVGHIASFLLSSSSSSQHNSQDLTDQNILSLKLSFQSDSMLEPNLKAYWHFSREENFASIAA